MFGCLGVPLGKLGFMQHNMVVLHVVLHVIATFLRRYMDTANMPGMFQVMFRTFETIIFITFQLVIFITFQLVRDQSCLVDISTEFTYVWELLPTIKPRIHVSLNGSLRQHNICSGV